MIYVISSNRPTKRTKQFSAINKKIFILFGYWYSHTDRVLTDLADSRCIHSLEYNNLEYEKNISRGCKNIKSLVRNKRQK